MARTIDQWVDSLARGLTLVPAEMRQAKAAELVHGTQVFQRNAPRGRKRLQSGKARGYPALYRSILTDRTEGALYTQHPGAELLEHGGIVRPLRGRFLRISLRAGGAAAGTVTIPLSGGRRAVMSGGRASRLLAILVPFVAIRARRWISRSLAETTRGADERIADQVLRGEVTGG